MVKKIKDLREKLVKLGLDPKTAGSVMSFAAAEEIIEKLTKAKEAEKVKEVEKEKVETIADDSTIKENKSTEQDWQAKADRMYHHLEKQSKVRVLIPLNSNEKVGVVKEKMVKGIRRFEHVSGAIWSKTFNGYTVVYPKGTYVDVPEQIADNIAKEQNQTELAGQHLRLDRTDPKTGTTVGQQLN